MFRAYLGPSSGGTTVCILQLVLIVLCRGMSVVLDGIISTKCCIHTVVDSSRYVMAQGDAQEGK